MSAKVAPETTGRTNDGVEHGDQPAAETVSREYLTFRLDEEEYAVPIGQVKELRAWEPVTRVPHAAAYECGLINVRGAIVPVLDLRKRLGFKAQAYNRHTVVIMFSLPGPQGKDRTSGAVVDALSDVVRFPDHAIQPPPQLSRKQSMRFAAGVIEHNNRMIVLLDVAGALNNSG
jgi:purine-binding chemotaxis protein CheW